MAPTERSESGTAEEFERVLARHRAGENVEIAFFFKDAAIDFRSTDLDQLAKVKSFENDLHRQGAFTKVFRDEDSLRLEIGILLDKAARRFALDRLHNDTKPEKSFEAANSGVVVEESHSLNNGKDEELGLYDIIENLQSHAQAASETLAGMNEG